MDDFDFDEEENGSSSIKLDIDVLVRLIGQDEPMVCRTTISLPLALIENEDDVDVLELYMTQAEMFILEVLDTVSEHRFLFRDSRENVHIAVRDQVQCISILAPDLDTIANLTD